MANAQVEPQRGGYEKKILVGLVLIVLAFISLWLGSPARTGTDPNMVYAWIFTFLFALGFIIGSMGLMGAERDYPALVSGLVLYFIVGALIAVFLYVTKSGVSGQTLSDVDTPGFWAHWLRVMAMWPYELISRAGLMGYMATDSLN
jgi:hypothetical protein